MPAESSQGRKNEQKGTRFIMGIGKEEIVHVGTLARLHLDKDAVALYEKQLGEVLAYMETLNRLATEDVAPTSHVISISNAFRDDTVTESVTPETGLANAPEAEDTTFVVPRIID